MATPSYFCDISEESGKIWRNSDEVVQPYKIWN